MTNEYQIGGTTIAEDSNGNIVISVDEIIIGGKIYKHDGNINVTSATSTTYTVSGTYDEVVVIPGTGSFLGFNEAQVNGDTGTNYDLIDESGTATTGQSAWSIPRGWRREYLKLYDRRGDRIQMASPYGAATNDEVAGVNTNVNGPITEITLSDAGGSARDTKARVYGRDMQL